jgi:hypothetical protein
MGPDHSIGCTAPAAADLLEAPPGGQQCVVSDEEVPDPVVGPSAHQSISPESLDTGRNTP